MVEFRQTDSKCLVCNEGNKIRLDMSINRPFRNNENIITFAVCKKCLNEIKETIEITLDPAQ